MRGRVPLNGAGGRHACAVVGDRSAGARIVADWVRAGLGAGERVLWVGADGAGPLSGHDADEPVWQREVERGRVAVMAPEAAVALEGPADIGLRLDEVRALERQAVDEGYAGLRLGVDVMDALPVIADVTTQLRFEAAWEELTRERAVSLLCVYDETAYGPRLEEAVAAHPRGLLDGQASAAVEPGGVRLAGEIDLLNHERFGRFLEGAVRIAPAVIDLSGLAFVDVRGVAELVRLSRALGPSARLRVVAPPSHFLRALALMGWADEVEVVDG